MFSAAQTAPIAWFTEGGPSIQAQGACGEISTLPWETARKGLKASLDTRSVPPFPGMAMIQSGSQVSSCSAFTSTRLEAFSAVP